MKKRVIFNILWILMIVANIYLFIGREKQSIEYEQYYNYPAEKIVSEELKYISKGGSGTHSYGLTEDITTTMNKRFKSFTGVEDLGEVEFETDEINIQTKNKNGNIKILITDPEDNIIIYEEVKGDYIGVTIPGGKCKIKLVGVQATGEIEFKSKTILKNSKTIDYTDKQYTEFFKNNYNIVSLSDQEIYLYEDTLYINYYFDRQVSEEQYNTLNQYNENYLILGKASVEEIPYKEELLLGEVDVPWKNVKVQFNEGVKTAVNMSETGKIRLYKNIDRKAGTYELIK